MINQNWVFGNGAGLQFGAGSSVPTVTSGFAINTFEGCASISDSSGNLLFYTDGQEIWDSANNSVYSGLLGDPSSTQSAIIVPKPGSSHEYYIFTTDGSTNTAPYNHFNGVLVDTTIWQVTPLSSLMTMPSTAGLSPTERVTAVQHPNCRDFWVITIVQKAQLAASSGPGIFRVFLVEPNDVTHVLDEPMNRVSWEAGYLKISPDGTLLTVANNHGGEVFIYPFDSLTGQINIGGLVEIIAPTDPQSQRIPYGIEYSANGQYLYYSTISITGNANSPGFLYQVDLAAPSPTSTFLDTIPNTNGQRYAIGALQRGPDGVIYIAKDAEASLGAILDADTASPTIDQNYITLVAGTNCFLGLPNLLPNPCSGEEPCSCKTCNDDADAQNQELIDRATTKHFTQKSDANCDDPFSTSCNQNAVVAGAVLQPCFSFHWGDGANDQIEEHDTEVFYLTACNPFQDMRFNGLQITKVTLTPGNHPIDKIHIVPDRFVTFGCLEPCACQTREFAMITRANDIAGGYALEVEYCFESVSVATGKNGGVVQFKVEITED